MLFNKNSLLNNLHRIKADDRTKLFLEALSFNIRIIDSGYTRLVEILTSGEKELNEEIVKESWTIVDSLYRLKCILGIIPGLKKKEIWFQSTFRKLVNVESSRHFIEHYDRELEKLYTNTKPLVGHIGYMKLTEGKRVATAVFVPGVIKSFKGLKMVNPAGKEMRAQLDHITLFLAENEVDISDIYHQLEKFVSALEEHISKKYPKE